MTRMLPALYRAALRKDLMAEVEKVKQSVATTNDNVVTLEVRRDPIQVPGHGNPC